jgi:hypothetical protein
MNNLYEADFIKKFPFANLINACLSFTGFVVSDTYLNYVGMELRIWNRQFH